MTQFNPTDAFSTSEIYDLSDLVKGGFNGDANVPLQALFNQTLFLKNRLENYESVKILTDNYSFDLNNDHRAFFLFQITQNKAFTLPAVGSMRAGERVTVKASITGVKALTVQSINNEPIIDGGISWFKWDNPTAPAIYLCDGEKLVLIAAGDHWIVDVAPPQLYFAGESFGARRPKRNTVFGDGSIYQRADVPRVALFMQSLTLGQEAVTDAQWLSDPGGIPIFRACYSNGNGTTTLRVPDERGLSVRHLDQGRNFDQSRLWTFAGGYEPDKVGPHVHPVIIPKEVTSTDQNGTGKITGGGNGNEPQDMLSFNTKTNADLGSAGETIMKNFAKISLIPY